MKHGEKLFVFQQKLSTWNKVSILKNCAQEKFGIDQNQKTLETKVIQIKAEIAEKYLRK